ncbi:MAG TPA: PH domain-containing protein [Flavobacterium sp.]|jgi:putative membrane protein
MDNGFSSPQRQSEVGILVMFFNTLQQYARALLPVLFLWIFKFDQLNKVWLTIGLVVVLVLIAIVAYLQYRNFTFFLDQENQEFVITEGVFNKTRTVIQLNKIQQVNITQSLLQRLINVYALDVDTAGSNNKEGKIRAVSHELALALKARLLQNDSPKVGIPNEEESPEIDIKTEKPFIAISFLSLLKVGVTSNYLKSFGLIVAFLATIYENVTQYTRYSEYDSSRIHNYFDGGAVLRSIAIVIGILLVSVLVINIVRVVVRYYDFTITRQSGSLLLSFGLLSTKSTIVKPEKVQIAAISQNYFQKKLDILELQIKQATSGEKEEKKSAIEIPGCNTLERDAVLNLLYGTIPTKGYTLRPNFRKLVFSLFLTIVVPLVVYWIMGVYVDARVFDFALFAMAYALFTGVVLFFSFRNYRLFINERFIIKQSGAWDITNEIIEPGKIQAVTTSQLFWHKPLNIGSLTIHTAGGSIHFQLGDYTAIKSYVNLWLYELETSDSNWM